MQSWEKHRAICYKVVVLIIVMAFTILGCDGDNNFDNAEINELENKTFIFPDGQALDFPGQRVTLEVRTLRERLGSRVARFILTAPAGTARGEISVDEDDFLSGGLDLSPESECEITIVTTDIPQYTVGATLQFRPCDVDNSTGALRLVNDADEESISLPPS
jgi:hypothetical protein